MCVSRTWATTAECMVGTAEYHVGATAPSAASVALGGANAATKADGAKVLMHRTCPPAVSEASTNARPPMWKSGMALR